MKSELVQYHGRRNTQMQIILKKLFIFVMTVAFSVRAMATERETNSLSESDKNKIETEIQKLKPALAEAEVISFQLNSGNTLSIATISSTESAEGYSEFYVRQKNSKSWIYLEQMNFESEIDFNKDGIIKISKDSGGTTTEHFVMLWRYEEGKLKPIGQDWTGYQNWALLKKSKYDPIKIVSSTNFLTGKTIVTSEFYNGKKKKDVCNFDSTSLRQKRISDLKSESLDIPDCPKKENNKINGKWKLVQIACSKDDFTKEGALRLDAILSERESTVLTISGEEFANYTIEIKKGAGSVPSCTMHRSERWLLKGTELKVSDTVVEYKSSDLKDSTCQGRYLFEKARFHKLIVGDKMEIQLTGKAPDSNIPECIASVEKLYYQRVK